VRKRKHSPVRQSTPSYGPTLVLALGLAHPHIGLSLLNVLNFEIITKKMNAETSIFRPRELLSKLSLLITITYRETHMMHQLNILDSRLYIADGIDNVSICMGWRADL